MNHVEAVTRTVAYIAAAYGPKFVVNEATVAVWLDLLRDAPPDEITTAAQVWCRSEKWPPSPAELRAHIPSLCRCGQLSCAPCRKRRVEAITRGPTKRLYGSGGAFFPAPTSLNGTSHAQLTEGDDE